MALTRQIRHGFELLLPELGDLNGLCLTLFALGSHALLFGVVQHLLEEVRQNGIHHVEEVLSPWSLAIGKLVREELHPLFIAS